MVKSEPRFAIDQPLRIRRGHDSRWRAAMTVNVSRTGLLFCSDLPLAVGDDIEVYILLHDYRGNELAPVTLATDRVVRVVDSPPGAAIEFTSRSDTERHATAG
jgi:hypothetical protein